MRLLKERLLEDAGSRYFYATTRLPQTKLQLESSYLFSKKHHLLLVHF